MQHDIAGDPITGVKWSRRTTRKIAEQLATLGIAVSKNTVGRLLKDMDFKLRVNRKQISSSKSPLRNQQFLHIGEQRQRFASQGLPILSVDSKKKELIGAFKNPGAQIANRTRSTITIFAPRPTRWPRRAAFTTRKPTAERCSLASVTTPRPSPSIPSPNGGWPRDDGDTQRLTRS